MSIIDMISIIADAFIINYKLQILTKFYRLPIDWN